MGAMVSLLPIDPLSEAGGVVDLGMLESWAKAAIPMTSAPARTSEPVLMIFFMITISPFVAERPHQATPADSI